MWPHGAIECAFVFLPCFSIAHRMDNNPSFQPLVIQVDKKGRRRYISRTASDTLNYGNGYYNNYTYTLPNNGFAVPNLSVYGSGLPSCDVMSRYTSKTYDTSKPYDTSKAYDSSIGYGSRTYGLGDSSKYGTTLGQSYLGTHYDGSSGSRTGSTYDGRSFGTDENIRFPRTEHSYDRYRDTHTSHDAQYDHGRLYTPSKLEDYVTESQRASPRSNWRDTYSEKYGKFKEETHLPYQSKYNKTENKDEQVSSDLEEPSAYPSYYSRYRERHKKDKANEKSDILNVEHTTKSSELTPREKLAIIRKKIQESKRDDDDELERPSSFELSQESPRSLSSPITKTFDDHAENIPRWHQRKALEDVTDTDSNQGIPKHARLSKNLSEIETDTPYFKDRYAEGGISAELPENSPLSNWRRQRQVWEQQETNRIDEKTENMENAQKKIGSNEKDLLNSKPQDDNDQKFQDEKLLDDSEPPHMGDLKMRAEAVKNILRQRDSPILRSRYNEVKRRHEFSKDSSKDDGSDTNSRTSSVDLGSSRPASSDFSDNSRPSSFIFGTEFIPHKDQSDTTKPTKEKTTSVRTRGNVQNLKDSVHLSDDSGFVDAVRDIPKAIEKSSSFETESPKAFHEKLRFGKDQVENSGKESQRQKADDKMHSLLYGKKEEVVVVKKREVGDKKTFDKLKRKDKDDHEKKHGTEDYDPIFFRRKTNQQNISPSVTEKEDISVKVETTERRPKSITDIYKPEVHTGEHVQPIVFGQTFTPKTDRLTSKSKVMKTEEKSNISPTPTSNKTQSKDLKSHEHKSAVSKDDDSLNKSVDKKISEQRKKLKGLYKKAQTTDIASLLSNGADNDSESEENSTASSISMTESEADKQKASTPITFAELSKLSRVERIAKYKEERKKQLANIANKFGDKDKKDAVPSLFLSARQYEEEKASLNRSQSVKVDSPQKSVTPVVRSKSLHGDTDSPKNRTDYSQSKATKSPEEEVKSPREKYYQTLSKRDHKISVGDSDNEDDTIEQINARTREALSTMVKKDLKKSSDDKDHETKSSKGTLESSNEELEGQSKKSNYMFSMEKMRNKFLFGEELEKMANDDKKAKEVKTEDDSFIDKTQKRRRQLPSIPAALGKSPETTRPKSSIELSSPLDQRNSSPKLQRRDRVDPKDKKHHRRRQIFSEDDVDTMTSAAKAASVLNRSGDFVSFKMDGQDGQTGESKSNLKTKALSTLSSENSLKSKVQGSMSKQDVDRKASSTSSVESLGATKVQGSISKQGVDRKASSTSSVESLSSTKDQGSISKQHVDRKASSEKSATKSEAGSIGSKHVLKRYQRSEATAINLPKESQTDTSKTGIKTIVNKGTSANVSTMSTKDSASKTASTVAQKAESKVSTTKSSTVAANMAKPGTTSAKKADQKTSVSFGTKYSNQGKTASSASETTSFKHVKKGSATSASDTSTSASAKKGCVTSASDTVTKTSSPTISATTQSSVTKPSITSIKTTAVATVAGNSQKQTITSSDSKTTTAPVTTDSKSITSISMQKPSAVTTLSKTTATPVNTDSKSIASISTPKPSTVTTLPKAETLRTTTSSSDFIRSTDLSVKQELVTKKGMDISVSSSLKTKDIHVTMATKESDFAMSKPVVVSSKQTAINVPQSETSSPKTLTSVISTAGLVSSMVTPSIVTTSVVISTVATPIITNLITASSVVTPSDKSSGIISSAITQSSVTSLSVATPNITSVESTKNVPINISTASTIRVSSKKEAPIVSTLSDITMTTTVSEAQTTPVSSVSCSSSSGIPTNSLTSSATKTQKTELDSLAPVESSLSGKSFVSHVSSRVLQHSLDSNHIKENSLSRSKSLTDKDSPLQSPRTPKASPRIHRVGVLADAPDLDDILMENVEYLSDIEICSKEKIEQGPVAQALNAEQQKTKRSLRKKILQRSKSDAEKHHRETEGSSQDTNIQKQTSVTKTEGELSTSKNIQNGGKYVAENQYKRESPEVFTKDDDLLPPQQTVAKVTEVIGHMTTPLQSEVAISYKAKPSLSQSSSSSFTSSFDLELSPRTVEKVSETPVEPDVAKVEVTGAGVQRLDSERKRREDKSASRKSSLNKSGGLSGGDKQSISSSLSSDSSEQVSSKSQVTQSSSQTSQHGVNDHSQNGKLSLDHLLPSKFSFPSKVSSAISKFSHESEAEKKGDESTKVPPKITRKNNFSSLLQRFSSPEPQDDLSSKKQGGLRRQEACAISSSGSSDESRRNTLERSQSLRVKRTPPPDDIETRRGVQRAGSFKSDFMRRTRYSPDPVERRALPETPDKDLTEPTQSSESEEIDEMKSSRIYLCTSSDKPSDELAGILKKRKEHVKIQQKDGEKDERERITSKKIEKSEKDFHAADVDEVIENSEVLSLLKVRRQETDSKTSDASKKPLSSVHNEHVQVQSTETVSKQSPVSQHSDVNIRSHTGSKLSHDQAKSNVTTSYRQEVKSDISDIDTSLAVLDAVSQDIDGAAQQDSRRKLSVEDVGNIAKALSKLDVESPEQVTTFIKDVRRTSLGKMDAENKTLSDEVGNQTKEETQVSVKTSLTHEKVEELRKSPERKSRMSPKLLEKVKATEAKLASLGTVNLKRSESYGHKDGENHRPKGILKRTTSMKKSGVVVDPELATILQRRRSRHEDDVEELDHDKKVTPSAKDDIKESLKRELEQRSSTSQDDEQDVQMPSISERIFHMETKLEETKSCPITPKSRSGATTPKISSLYRSGSFNTQSFDQDQAQSVNGNNLLQKLNTLAEQRTTSVADKRRSFQKRTRDDWRTRTQPVTNEELEEAGNLASVQSFRAEVLRKASINVFEQLSKQDKSIDYNKKTEYPQHIPRRRRSRLQRHKTLPVTAAELGSVPETEEVSMMSYRLKTGHSELRDSKADSGILSASSDLEGYESARSDSSRSLSMDAELNEDDPARLSVSAKASIFKNISEKKSSASGAKRYIDRKKRERSRTLPVTDDEVHSAAEIADGEGETTKPENKGVEAEETEGIHDEKSKRSLAEKVQLFQNLKQEEKSAEKVKVPPPVARRRKGKLASRFSTQPVTFEEVEKAAKISPLAMSMVKPPDPELLKGLSLSAQREIMAKHAEASLSQPGSRSTSRHGSMSDLSDESKKGILKSMENVSTEANEVHGILKPEHAKTTDQDVKSILKSDHPHHNDAEQRSILKHSEDLVSSKGKIAEQKGILKHEEDMKVKDTSVKAILKHDDKKTDAEITAKPILKHDDERVSDMDKKSVKPILKHDDLKSDRAKHSHEGEGNVRAILRHNETIDRHAKSEEIKPILKHHDASDRCVSSTDFDKRRKSLEESLHFTPILKHTEDKDSEKSSEPKGILKKESSFETKVTEPEKSSLKKSPSRELKDQKLHGILHKSSDEVKSDLSSNITKDGKTEKETETSEDATNAAQKRRGRDPAEKERYLTQPAESTPEKSPETPRKFKYTGRNKTQPITPDEKREAEIDSTVTRSGSLKDRLNLLKQSGEEDWKKRVHKSLDGDPGSPMEVKLREKVGPTMARPSSIADRLNLLNTAQAGWKDRVEETDAKRFTVAHKLAGQVEDSPLMRKLKSRSKKESESDTGSELSSPSTPSKDWPKIPIPQTLIMDPTAKLEPRETTPPPEKEDIQEEAKGPVKVTVPDINDESIRSFFHSREITELSTQKVDVSIDDFNELFIMANDMLPSIHRIRPKRKHQGSLKNPLRSMHTTMEIKTEYEEVTTGVAEKEIKRIKTEKISKGAGFAEAALAGLASTEDFSNVNLRRTDSMKGLNSIDPYKELMLLHIKGRRRTQVRLVEPVPSSINSGDCYILVTPEKIIQWIGEFANVIEKAKTADVATFIQQKKDLGCKSPTTVAVVEEKKQYMGAGKHFWSSLGGQTTAGSAGPSEEDELYENHIVETNMVYKLVDNALVPYREYWGAVPKIEMLKKDEVLVFDFGSELYVWQGKAVKPDRRKLGVKLARKLWENGYDYSAALINPLCPLKTEECGGLKMQGQKRPDWALFGKVNQNMETILFREKFADWPDTSRFIKVKGQDDTSGSKVDLTELKPYDANLMLKVNDSPVTLLLEGSHVGRGTEWDEDMDGFIRKQSIITLGVKVWHVLEYEHFELEKLSYGQFHDGDTYVVRWQYMISNKDSKDLKGSQSRRSLVGRERCAYFFWQGKNSTVNEKGASALMTVELDEERGPQIRVDEGKEIPCFLNLFNGETMVHIGKREEESTNTQGPWKCYCVRNVLENEMCLIEVLADMSSFRSRSSFLLLNIQTGKLYVWHGCQSPAYTQKLALAAAEKLKQRRPLEVGLNRQATISCTEIQEGKETLDFWRVMGTSRNDRTLYCSLLTESKETQSIRLFHMSSVSGTFEVQEILNPTRVPDLVSPFPVLQSDLYRTSQPELYLLDRGDMVYLWHGWWPEANSEVENVQTGSAQAKFNVDRSCAIQTALEYCKVKYGENKVKPVAVFAGLEPLEFTNLFPYWEVNKTARELNLKDGKKDNELTPLDEILEKMSKTRYTFEELQERPLPEGVDALKLEAYLDDDEFQEILQMTKDEFYALPAWKQHATKKDVGLF